MLDLNKLERLLDEALAKETPESLTNWLLSKRKPVYSINEASSKPLNPISFKFCTSKQQKEVQSSELNDVFDPKSGTSYFSNAA